MPTPDDLKHWMAAVATHGDREAFAALFRHFAPRVKGYLMRSGTPADLAEELAQEAMVSLWRRAATFDPARAAVSTWLFTIARNLRIDQHRRAVAEGLLHAVPDDELEGREPHDPADGPDDRALAAELGERVRTAMATLTADQALVLKMSYFEEHAHSRIAQELGLPLGTVKSRIRLALLHLRRQLEGVER